MSGRLEHALRWDEKIKRMLKDMPAIATEYYNNISATKEPSTCFQYLYYVYTYMQENSTHIKNFEINNLNEQRLVRFIRNRSTKIVEGKIEETSFSARRTVWFALNSFCKYLYKRKLLAENPMELIDRPTNKDVVHRIPLTTDHFKAILDGFEEGTLREKVMSDWYLYRDKLIFILFMNTGMRNTALTEIDITDINFEKQTLTVIEKRHKTLVYQLSNNIISAIQEWLNIRRANLSVDINNTALFINENGERLLPRSVDKIVKKYTEEYLGTSLTAHKFRSAFFFILYDQTHDIEFVRDAVGHGSTDITQRYIVKKDPAQKKAVEMMQILLNKGDK